MMYVGRSIVGDDNFSKDFLVAGKSACTDLAFHSVHCSGNILCSGLKLSATEASLSFLGTMLVYSRYSVP